MIQAMYRFLILLGTLTPLLSLQASTIHVFGDSHAHFTFRENDTPRHFNTRGVAEYTYIYKNTPLAIHWLKGKTMYRIGASALEALNIMHHGVKEDDIVVFAFGEIDTRCHIGKQRDQKNRTLQEIIDSLVHNYIQAILKNRAQYKNICCVVMEVIPPTNQCFNPEVPFYGSLEDRITITQLLNTALQEACIAHNILFLPTHNLYANSDGSLNTALSDTFVHVGLDYNYLIKDQLLALLYPIH